MYRYAIVEQRPDGSIVKVREIERPVPIEAARRKSLLGGPGDKALWPIEPGLDETPDAARRVWVEAIDRRARQAAIDTAAEALRLRVLTRGAGQMLVYEGKRREAERAAAALRRGEDIAEEDYPLLGAEVGVTAPDLPGVVAAVTETARRWTLLAAAIEARRLAAKRAIAEATTVGGIEAAMAVDWPDVLEE